MGQNEEEILLEIVSKIEEVLKAFKENFDFDNYLSYEYSSLSIVGDYFRGLVGK